MALVSSYDPLISSRAAAMRAKARKGPEPAAAFQELVRASLELEGPGGGYLTILWEVVDSSAPNYCSRWPEQQLVAGSAQYIYMRYLYVAFVCKYLYISIYVCIARCRWSGCDRG